MLIGTEWRCDWTGNEPGTDTRMPGAKPCECQGCTAHEQLTALRARLAEVEGARDRTRESDTVLPDGSAFFTASFPLPKDHWIYSATEGGFTAPPPMPFRIGTSDPRRDKIAEMVRAAGRYAVQASTTRGQDTNFDPDAMLQNFVVGMLGYWTADGLGSDAWQNPSPAPDGIDDALASAKDGRRTFRLGDRVTKIKGSKWTGRVVGTYRTSITPEGYAVESETEVGSVQIYPVAALASAGEVPERLMDLDRAEEVRRILIRVAKFTQMKLDMGSIGRKPLQDILDLCAGKVPEWMAEIEANESQIPERATPTPENGKKA